jgi:hypothetical protein
MAGDCSCCGSTDESQRQNGPHWEAFCCQCGRHKRFLKKSDLGIAPRSVQSTHAAIKPKKRAGVLLRASGRCELCGAGPPVILNVGHLISVENGHQMDLTDEQINSDENLCCMCEECNLGLGSEPVPLRVAVSMVMARVRNAGKGALND